jgi:hypothetical protein
MHYAGNWKPSKKQKPFFGQGNASEIIIREIEKELK